MIRIKSQYAKILNLFTLEYAPEELGGVVGFNNDEAKCLESGYLPVKFSSDTEGWKTYEVVGGVIVESTFIPEYTVYKNRVIELIRERYTEADEAAILRKKLAGMDLKSFDAYNSFCEECKIKAKLEQLL